MKTSWQSATVAEKFMTEKLRWSLRLRMVGSWTWLALEILSAILLLILSAVQVAMGQYGMAAGLAILTGVFVAASVWARRSPLRAARGSLIELIDLTIERARRSKRFAWANYLTTLASAGYVLAVFFTGLGDAPAVMHDPDRTTFALAVFALYAAGVGFYHRYARNRMRRFTELRQKFTAPETPAP